MENWGILLPPTAAGISDDNGESGPQGRFKASGVTVTVLLHLAYDMNQIQGAPG